MRPRDAITGLVAVGVLAGCAAEVASSEQREIQEKATTTTLDIGAISAESTIGTKPITIPVPSTTMPELDLNYEDEIGVRGEQDRRSSETTTTAVDTTAPETTTTTVVETVSEPEILIPREALYDGNKVAEMTLTNVNGENLVNIPVYVVTDMLDGALMNEQLERGAILMVSHPEVNPDMIEQNNGIPQMGLPFEMGVTNFFGHNMSYIEPDWENNGEEGPSQRVFNLIDEAEEGSILSVQFTEEAGGELAQYVLTRSYVVSDVQPGGNGTGMTMAKATELYGEGNMESSLVRLIKCTPDGQVTDRYVAEFVPA